MSKKKAAGGTTMTLKDFHGGSIPSDLPLPSAPGVTVRPMDRPGFDRPSPWGNPMGRSDHRLRPGSAGAVRNFDDKTPFLSSNAHIGRNFDEDERKPLDGSSGPRRTVSDDSIRGIPMRMELKPDYSSGLRPPSQQVTSASPSSYASRVSEANHEGGISQNINGNSTYATKFGEAPSHVGPDSSKLGGNVWAIRKEAVKNSEPSFTTWSGPDAATKLAHASALDKVSSGRWQSKQAIQYPANVEPIKHTEVDSSYMKSSYHPADMPGGVEYQEAMLVKHAERSLIVNDGVRGSVKDLPAYDRPMSPMYARKVENNSHLYCGQPAHNDGKSGGSGLPTLATVEQSERPKLKLLPRSKPLDSSDLPIDYNQGYPQNQDHHNKVNESFELGVQSKSVLTTSDSGKLAVDRPKLNLKPRSQAVEQVEEAIEKGRNTVFGGARPRELVLKERGIDDIGVDNHDVVQPLNRVKQDIPRTELVSPSRYNAKAAEGGAGVPFENRIRKSNNNDKRENRVVDAADMQQKRNWRSENNNPRNFREPSGKNQQQPPQERPPSPETWRKQPLDEPRPRPASSDGLRYGKAASAVELAQAFSKSVSDPKQLVENRFPSQRGMPRSGQIPFSRLTDPSPRPQINGY